MQVTVEEAGKYGIKAGGVWYSNYDKEFEHQKAKPGDVLEVELQTSKKSGKPYINKLVKRVSLVQTAPVAAPAAAPKAERPPVQKGRDFEGEARGKTRCQMYSAALQSPAVANLAISLNKEDLLKLVREIANDGTTYTFGE